MIPGFAIQISEDFGAAEQRRAAKIRTKLFGNTNLDGNIEAFGHTY